uniref:Uncharacterized protein n=1 Tax=Arundo donax TaxID=35708 RepID=A0A0A8Y8S2_ARUDO
MFGSNRASPAPPVGAQGAKAAPASTPAREVHQLTPSEMAERHRQGLCFNCDEKFLRGHHCAHLFYIEYDDTTTDDTNWEADADNQDDPHISLYAIAGVDVSDTVRLKIRVYGLDLVTLVDSGSTRSLTLDQRTTSSKMTSQRT